MATYKTLISSEHVRNGITVNQRTYITVVEDKSEGTITLTCRPEHYTTDGFFTCTAGTCKVTVNDKNYSFSTSAMLISGTEKVLGSVTTDPIKITAVDTKTKININVNWDCTILYYEGGLDVLPSSTSFGGSSHSGYILVNPIYSSTPIVVTGTEITEISTMDMVNNRTHTEATHSLAYTCGNVTETLFAEQSGDYLTFTLPETLAAQNTKGLDLSVTFTLTTHFPWGASGSKTSTVIYTIPDNENLKPHCTIEVTDGEHLNNVQLADRYGGYVQNYSRFNIKVTPILAYDSPIVSYTIIANDETHVGYSEVETALLKHSGENEIVVSLTDERGRSNEFTLTANVLEYSKPYVSDLKIDRCDRVGTVDSAGDYIKVTFSAEITPLNNINSASYALRYQTSAGLDQTDVNLTEYAGQYNVTNGTYIFLADSANAYSVTLTATDDLDDGFEHEGADDTTTIWNALASGDGFAFGTLATLAGVLESVFKIFPHGGFMFPEFEGSTLIDTDIVPNVYRVSDGKDILKSPFDGEYTLIVLPGGGVGDLLFIGISNDPEIKINALANSSWGSWKTLTLT